tara:strand:- start:224 stop:658 length:435 start_codon:yes stop_codon:yes gene_type:complete
MKNIYQYMFISLFLVIYPAISQGASPEIERALEILLADYDIDNYLKVRDEVTLSSGYYLVQSGDTLDELIVRLVGNTPIRKKVLREAFVHANPNSFRNSNPNYMLAGIRLRIPNADDIIELLFDMNSPAMRNMNQSRESWVHFP